MKRAVVIVAALSIVSAIPAAPPSSLHVQGPHTPAAAYAPAALGKIAYASDVDGDFEIFVMRPDGTRRRQITHNRVDDVSPSWSPDGTRIVFERDTSFYGDDLYIADVGGGRAVPWVVTKDDDESQPRWSPDGSSIAFRTNDEGDESDLFLIPVDKSDGYSIVARGENGYLSHPAWSPDGSKVAFIEAYDSSGLAIAPACCDSWPDYEPVPAATEWPTGLDWSPDGSCLLFGDVSGRGYDLHTVAVDGGIPQPITRGRSPSYPGSWSPDSSQVVYDSNAARSWDVYVIDADGTDVHRLTETPKVHEIMPDWWAPPGAEPATPPCGKPSPTPSPSPPQS